MPGRRLHAKKNFAGDHQPALTALSLPCATPITAPATDELTDRLKNLLIFEEGRIVLRNGLHVSYRDSKGIATIGYGFNLQDGAAAGILGRVTTKSVADLIAKTAFLTEAEAQSLLLISEFVALKGVHGYFPQFGSLDLPRQVVLAAMVYQIGAGGFGRFGRLIGAVKVADWSAAVASMESSQWYRSDSPQRARRMVVAMANDTFPPSAVPSPPGQRFAVPGLPSAAAEVPANAPRRPWPFDND
jgi:GH24 family phage-related lysozyme (muramidase)